MSKIQLSTVEFDLLINKFAGKKGYFRWREFDTAIEEAFTTKNLEKNIDVEVGMG